MTPNPLSALTLAGDAIVAQVRPLLVGRRTPFLVAIDGKSGSGKSTLATMVAETLNAALISSDDFYAAETSDAAWDERTPEARSADVIDWRRLRLEALEPLLCGRPAVWHAFDFARRRRDGTYPLNQQPTRCDPATVILVEGAYSSRPELGDVITLSVLVDSPTDVRHQRLVRRGNSEFVRAWHARWDSAEEYYFSRVRPQSTFDLVVSN